MSEAYSSPCRNVAPTRLELCESDVSFVAAPVAGSILNSPLLPSESDDWTAYKPGSKAAEAAVAVTTASAALTSIRFIVSSSKNIRDDRKPVVGRQRPTGGGSRRLRSA